MSETPLDTSSLRAAALIVAAGRGTRMGGDLPKQYRDLGGTPVIARTIAAFDRCDAVQQIVVVIHADDADLFARAYPEVAKSLVVVTSFLMAHKPLA